MAKEVFNKDMRSRDGAMSDMGFWWCMKGKNAEQSMELKVGLQRVLRMRKYDNPLHRQ